ncbi:DUF4359 domain-containing protein [Flavobacterium sp. MAH-1]|uniref:DUF4359 domain-containing protein n=1 Tax=Flavobacterium agri TaxID=2743471 RepID=A0A7Y9C4U0_9FLAO|nr:DUF4359 domain-containing protein [Flavobacterium agri]NUY79669.1 DUF4359 domain-containing protein [Flavobacterium agri]NYA69694.1 DUF4359 domain-containing protein [Flavobacterium agri]
MKTKHIFLAGSVLLLLIAAITNPDLQVHKETVRTTLKAYLDQQMADSNAQTADNEWSKAGQGFGNLLASALIDRLVDGAVTSENYVLFSLTKVTWEGQEKNIGFGAFGNVWLSKNLKDLQNESRP